jgi:addiction module RelE/StbE family toxin
MRIVWTALARDDLREIFLYITAENPNAARRLLSIIKDKVIALLDNPYIGRTGRVEGTRELVLSGTNYILPYRIIEQEIQILSVLHGAQQWPDQFLSNQ